MKKVFIGVLAALMLFAFVACDSQTGYKLPTGMTATVSKTEYLVGEKIDPNTITATVEFIDGSTQNFSGSQLGVVAAAMTEGEKTITLSYGAGEDTVTYDVTLNGYPVSAVQLGGSFPTTAASDGKIDMSGITATVCYKNAWTTRSLNAGEYEITASATGSAGTEDATAAITAISVFGTSLKLSDSDAVSVVGVPANWTVDIAAADPTAPEEFDPEDFDYDYEVVYVGPDGEEYSSISSSDYTYVGDNWTWEVYAVSENGGRRVAVLNEDYFVTAGTLPLKRVSLGLKGEETAASAATATITPIAANGTGTAITITIPWGEDYIEEFSSIVLGELTMSSITPSDFTFKANMKGGEEDVEVTPNTDFAVTIVDDEKPADGGVVRFYVSYGRTIDGEYEHQNVLVQSAPYTEAE